jgi:hypothetical protein
LRPFHKLVFKVQADTQEKAAKLLKTESAKPLKELAQPGKSRGREKPEADGTFLAAFSDHSRDTP